MDTAITARLGLIQPTLKLFAVEVNPAICKPCPNGVDDKEDVGEKSARDSDARPVLDSICVSAQ
jgi:hypothetical protein